MENNDDIRRPCTGAVNRSKGLAVDATNTARDILCGSSRLVISTHTSLNQAHGLRCRQSFVTSGIAHVHYRMHDAILFFAHEQRLNKQVDLVYPNLTSVKSDAAAT